MLSALRNRVICKSRSLVLGSVVVLENEILMLRSCMARWIIPLVLGSASWSGSLVWRSASVRIMSCVGRTCSSDGLRYGCCWSYSVSEIFAACAYNGAASKSTLPRSRLEKSCGRFRLRLSSWLLMGIAGFLWWGSLTPGAFGGDVL